MTKKDILAKLRERLKNKYRLVIMNDETLHEVVSHRLNLLTFYSLVSSGLILLFILFWLLTAFTPLKRFMPGYNDVYAHPEFIALYQRISEIEAGFEAQQLYTETLRKLLIGEIDSADMYIEDIKGSKKEKKEVKNENSFEAASPANAEEKALLSFQQIKTKSNEFSGKSSLQKMYLIPPVSGYMSAPFNPLKKHYGVDLVAPVNTAVKAITDGYVFSADWTLETGNTIGIVHDNNVISFYKHNAVNLKKVGTYVRAGEAIAIIGNTGLLSDGPHLHFELWVDGTPVNPEDYFTFRQ
jgi:murein DD-endopeptidase MepM/ murein hydrolase activator NlpD